MARYYVVDDTSRAAGCITTFFISLLIIAALAYFAFYAFLILLGIILAIACVIGAVITVRNLVLAIIDTSNAYRGVSTPQGSLIPSFIYRFTAFTWSVAITLFRYNIASLATYFARAGMYRLFSFTKWLNIFAGISILIFGSVLAVSVIALLVAVAAGIGFVILVFILALTVIFLLIGIARAAAFLTVNYIDRLSDSYRRTAYGFSDYITAHAFHEWTPVIMLSWQNVLNEMIRGVRVFTRMTLLSFRAWSDFARGIMLPVVGFILIFPFAIIHGLAICILYPIFRIITLIHP